MLDPAGGSRAGFLEEVNSKPVPRWCEESVRSRRVQEEEEGASGAEEAALAGA